MVRKRARMLQQGLGHLLDQVSCSGPSFPIFPVNPVPARVGVQVIIGYKNLEVDDASR